jgi:hypothetical protein
VLQPARHGERASSVVPAWISSSSPWKLYLFSGSRAGPLSQRGGGWGCRDEVIICVSLWHSCDTPFTEEKTRLLDVGLGAPEWEAGPGQWDSAHFAEGRHQQLCCLEMVGPQDRTHSWEAGRSLLLSLFPTTDTLASTGPRLLWRFHPCPD